MQEIQETRIRFQGPEDPLEQEMAAPSNILAWEIPWPEEPGGLQSMGSQRVTHDWAHNLWAFDKTPKLLLSVFFHLV